MINVDVRDGFGSMPEFFQLLEELLILLLYGLDDVLELFDPCFFAPTIRPLCSPVLLAPPLSKTFNSGGPKYICISFCLPQYVPGW